MSNVTIEQQINDILDELKNLRRSHDGITYKTGGANVRTNGITAKSAYVRTQKLDERLDIVEMDIEYLRNNLKDLIDIDTVDGLEYKNNMLFLTRNGERILPGVKIVGGSGTGGGTTPSTMTIKISMLNDSNTFYISEQQDAVLKFSYLSLDSGESTGRCTCNIYRNSVLKDTFAIDNGVETTINAKKYLGVGANEITVECSDIYNNKKSIVYYINVISLEITSTFNDAKVIEDDLFTFTYNQTGRVEKTVYFKLGTGVNSKTVSTTLPADSDKQQQQVLEALPHGAYPLEVYMTAQVGEDLIESNHLHYELMFKDENNKTPIIASSFNNLEVVQGELISIPFIVYDPEAASCSIVLRTSYYQNGELKHQDINRTVDYTKQTWNIRNVPVGSVTFSIIYNKLGIEYKKSHVVKVNENDIKVNAYTSGLEVFLSAEGRSNTELDPASWVSGDISTTFSNFNWGTNGWLEDDNGDTCLRLNGDARIEINFLPFKNDFKTTGKTFEFEFAIRNVNNRNAVVIDCFDKEGNQVGIQATADKMFFNSNNETVFCNYTENQRIRVGFTVQEIAKERFLCVYLDGVLSGIKHYDIGDSFAQSNAQTLKIGSSDCGVDIYAIRTYNLCLEDKQMTNNYIADIPNIVDKMDAYQDNDLYDDNGKLSYKKVKKKLPTVTFIGKMPTYKGDKKKNSVRMIFEHPTKPELNFDEILAQIDVQGTSSSGYVRKNWKTKHNNPHIHMEGELPAKVFCLKVDYAEATGTHNTQNANLVETFYDELIPPMNVPEGIDLNGRNLNTLSDISKVRTTITGFPICIFHLDTDDSELIRSLTIANLESGEYDVVFSSKGNFNYDKDAEDVFAFNSDYDTECWEFLKNEDPQSFLTPWPDNPLDYWEARYHPRLGDLEDLQDAKNDAAARALGDEMLSRFKKMYEWVHSTARGTYNGKPQASGLPLTDSEGNQITYTDKLGNKFTIDNDAYRLAKFRNEFENYFDMHYSAIYYVYTFFAIMADQRAKNMFLTYWRNNAYGPNDETNPGKWYPYFYDNDTSYGISNKGHLDFDYFHEDTDIAWDSEEQKFSNVFNGANSVLWCNFRDAFPSKVQSTYAKLRNDGKLSYNKVIDQFINQGSDQWSAAIYNQDADYKYISVYDVNADGSKSYPYLFQVRGDAEQHLEYFVENRIKFCDSKWMCADYLNNLTHTARVLIFNPSTSVLYTKGEEYEASENKEFTESFTREMYETYKKLKASEKVRPSSTQIKITPFSRMYYGVQYGAPSGDDITKGLISKKAENLDTDLVFEKASGTEALNDFETTIYGARDISSLGDLSNLYAKEIVISNCVKLLELLAGCSEVGPNGEQYCNPNLTTITTGNNTLLRKIDVSNCPNLKGSLNLSGCINIKEILAKGSGITSLSLPNGGYVNKLELPKTFNNLILKGQKYLTNDGILMEDFTSLNQLNIDNCPDINAVQLLEQCKLNGEYTVKFLRLTNVDLGTVTYDYLINTLAKIGCIDENNVTYSDRPAYIEGRCKIEEINGEQLANIKRAFPYLTVYYDTLELRVTFKNEDGSEQLSETLELKFNNGNSANGVTIDCPVEGGSISRPTKTSTDQYYFEFGGWSTVPNSDPDITALRGITADTTLYVAFNKILRSYPVTFYVEDNEPIVIDTYYGYTAQYPGIPEMPNVSNPGMYVFVGWAPSNENIKGATECYAQFVINEDSESIGNYALSEFEYTKNDTDRTLTLNKANVIENTGRILDKYTLDTEYTVTAINGIDVQLPTYTDWIGCFSESNTARNDNTVVGTGNISNGVIHNLEYVVLPDTLVTIGKEAFSECKSLLAITIPKNVSRIGDAAFDRCESLDIISVDPENITFKSEGNCLIDKNNNTLIVGSNSSIIPTEGVNKIGYHAFWGRRNLNSINIPDNIIYFGAGAFCECLSLEEINIPANATTFEAMCFYKTGIKKITFPENTQRIEMFVVHDCDDLTKIVIKQTDPTKITIYEQAFGTGSGKPKDLTIYVPWSEGQVAGEATCWGAVGAKIIYNYKGD